MVLEEEIVTSDDDLRRFQYRVIEMQFGGQPMPPPVNVLATVDVIEDRDGSLVIYSTDIEPVDDPNGDIERTTVEFNKAGTASFLRGLKEYLAG